MRRGSGLGLLLQKHEFGGFDTKFRSVYSITSCICFCKSAHQPQNWSAFAISRAIISQLYVISNLTKSIIPDRNRIRCSPLPYLPQSTHTPSIIPPPSRSVFDAGGPACPVGPVVTAPIAHAMSGYARLVYRIFCFAPPKICGLHRCCMRRQLVTPIPYFPKTQATHLTERT